MRIELAKKTSIWGLRDSDIFLTYANPGPVEVDWNKLTEVQRIALKSAIALQKIKTDDSSLLSAPKTKTDKKVAAPKKTNPLSKKAKALITNTMGKIKLEIANYTTDDIEVLRKAINMESRKKKPRKRVINMLREAIVSLSQEADKEVTIINGFEVTEEYEKGAEK